MAKVYKINEIVFIQSENNTELEIFESLFKNEPDNKICIAKVKALDNTDYINITIGVSKGVNLFKEP